MSRQEYSVPLCFATFIMGLYFPTFLIPFPLKVLLGSAFIMCRRRKIRRVGKMQSSACKCWELLQKTWEQRAEKHNTPWGSSTSVTGPGLTGLATIVSLKCSSRCRLRESKPKVTLAYYSSCIRGSQESPFLNVLSHFCLLFVFKSLCNQV